MTKTINNLSKIWKLALVVIMTIALTACKRESEIEDPQDQKEFWPEETGRYILKDGITEYKIVISEQAGEKVMLAKNELVEFFKKATGITLETITDLDLTYNPEDKYISLGNTKLLQNSGIKISEEELTKDGYLLKTNGNLVFIAGPSDYSALYGTYKFMYFSFLFKVYADDEILFEKVKDIPLYAFDFQDAPNFEERQLGYYNTTQNLLYSDRMRVRIHGDNWIYATHSHFRIMPKETYYKDHPDWYSKDGTQLCLTNEEMKAEFIKNLKVVISTHPNDKYILLGQEDSNTFCNCDNCQEAIKKYGTPSGVDMIFVNSVAEEIENWLAEVDPGRELLIGTFAYFKTLPAPATYNEETKTWTANAEEVKARDNVFIFVAPLETNYSYSFLNTKNSLIKNAFEGWSAITDKFAIWTYSANYFSYFTNFLNFSTQAQQYRELRDLGAFSVFDLGPWDTATPTFDKLRIYVSSQLLWNADQNVDDLIDDFLRNYYKEAYPAMREYFDTTRTYLEYLRNRFGLDATCYVNYNKIEYWPKKYLDKALEILDEALLLVEPLKEENPVLYEKLVNRINLESLSPRYFLLRFYQSSYTTSEQIAMIDEFEKIAKENNVTNWAESTNLTQGDNRISSLVESFRASVK